MLLFLCLQVICKALPGVKAEKNEIVNDIREHFQMLYSALQTRYTSIITTGYKVLSVVKSNSPIL